MTKETAKAIQDCWKTESRPKFLSYIMALWKNFDITRAEYMALCDKMQEQKTAVKEKTAEIDLSRKNAPESYNLPYKDN